MEAKELRIGNYIYLSDKEKIWQILDGHEIDKADANPFTEPIPLIEEWLLKFGFEFAFGQAYIPLGDDNDGHLLKDPKLGWILDDIEGFQIPLQPKYVHQLQNLYFALTGNELTIKQ